MKEKRQKEWRVTGASIDDATSNAEKNGNGGLKEEAEPARTGEAFGDILQEAREEKRINLSGRIGMPQGKPE